jgi:hypothetical protein
MSSCQRKTEYTTKKLSIPPLDWNHARGYFFRLLVFRTGKFCSFAPRPFHPLGSIRSFPGMVPTGSPVAAHRFSRLGNSY